MWRELRRLQTMLVMRSAMGNTLAVQDTADHMALLHTLRVAAGRPDEEENQSDAEMEEAAGALPNSNAFGKIEGGEEAIELLFGEEAPNSRQRSLVLWFCEQVTSA